jgi:hypothetical protein
MQVWTRAEGSVVETPGLPPVYDYEWYPQKVSDMSSHGFRDTAADIKQDDVPHALLFQDVFRFIQLADAALLPTSDVLEKESLDAARGWYKSIGKTLWTIGPSNPAEDPASALAAARDKASPEDAKVLSFLDHVHKSYGVNSVIYVRTSNPPFPSHIFSDAP